MYFNGAKLAIRLLFIAITTTLMKSRILLNMADSVLMFIDRSCRASSIKCTGNDYDLALLITVLILNGIVALIIVALIKNLLCFIQKAL